MSEREKEAARPRPRGAHDQSVGRQELEAEISLIQRNERCARRAAGLMAFMTAFLVAALGYPAILLENFPSSAPIFIIHLTYALCAGSLISLLAFAGLGSVYRKKLRRRKEACRLLAASLCLSPLHRVDTPRLRSGSEHCI